MWPSAGTSVGVVSELMNVHATLSVGVMACDVPGDAGGRALRALIKRDRALDVGVSAHDGNWRGKGAAGSNSQH